jgi:UDP-glucose 4-epimerase
MPIPSRSQFYDVVKQLQGENIDTVYWCAAGIMPNKISNEVSKGISEFDFFYDSINRNFAPRCTVLLSSFGLATYDRGRFVENPSNPVAMYFENRFRLEERFHQFGLEGAVLRLSNVYGPNVIHQYGVIANWIRSIQEGRPITVTDSLERVRDYVYIEDVISAIVASRDVSGALILDIGSGLKTSLGDLIGLFSKIVAIDVEYLAPEYAAFERTDPVVDLAKTQSEIGWLPFTELRDGLNNTFKIEGLLN